MASLITNAERAELTGIFADIFDTFKRNIVIYKESTRVPISVDSNNFVYGFGESQGQDAYTYQEVTGVFSATIRYKPQTIKLGQEINSYFSDGDATIKVQKECRDFINSGKTEKIIFDDRTFVLNSDERKKRFLDSEFWVFELKAVK